MSGRVVYRDVNDIFDFKDLFLNTINPRESLDLVEFAAVMRARPELQQQLFGRMGDVIVKMDENAKNSILTPFEKNRTRCASGENAPPTPTTIAC